MMLHSTCYAVYGRLYEYKIHMNLSNWCSLSAKCIGHGLLNLMSRISNCTISLKRTMLLKNRYGYFIVTEERKCDASPCKGGGTCVEDAGDPEGYTCNCKDGYYDHDCNTRKYSLYTGLQLPTYMVNSYWSNGSVAPNQRIDQQLWAVRCL